MIDQFLIFTPTGQVLFKHAPRKVADTVINSLVDAVFISDSAKSLASSTQNIETYSTLGYTIKYQRTQNPQITVACVYPSVTSLKYVNSLVDITTRLFRQLCGDQLLENLEGQRFILDDLDDQLEKFEKLYKAKLDELENITDESDTTIIDEKQPVDSKKKKNLKDGKKKLRKWGADGMYEEEVDGETLDFSTGETATSSGVHTPVNIDKEEFGDKDSKGRFVVKDLNDEIDAILKQSKKKDEVKEPFSFFKKYTGGKTITQEDIKTTLSDLQNHLIKKNVAPEVATHLTTNVEKALVGSKTKNWTSVQTTAKEALAKDLTKILTPGTSVNLLDDIKKQKKPYVISVVGVNGVGKSTNLSKLAFWLLQNDFKVLIAACDTFRSGAVEQLRVHVNNLKNASEKADQIELFEGGYGGSDLVAKIAKQAIDYASKNEFDIVLMDTAGRRHNDAQLMAPLASFAKAANPNKIIMVGEALVGTDSVQQARNFNAAFGAGRHLDFFIISKCDTVGDLIGTMVNMVYATNIPILFIGVGQTYTDIRTLSVEWAVNMLMS